MDEHDHIFLWPYLHWACFVPNVLEKVVDLTNLMDFCIVNSRRCQVLICVCKLFCLFQQTNACEKIKVDIMKRQKTSLSVFTSTSLQLQLHLHCSIHIMIYFNKGSLSSELYLSLFYMLVRIYALVKDFSFTLLYITVHWFELSLER